MKEWVKDKVSKASEKSNGFWWSSSGDPNAFANMVKRDSKSTNSSKEIWLNDEL